MANSVFTPERKPRALFLAPECPYPVVGGGALRAASLLEYLARRYTVDAAIFHLPGERVEFPPGMIDRVLPLELPHHSRGAAARFFRNGARIAQRIPPLVDRFRGYGAPLAAFVDGRPAYDLAVVEHFWCAPYWEQLGPRARHTVLDLHNVESAWHHAGAKAANWRLALAHQIFHRAALRLERHWLPRYSLLLATSPDDAVRIQRIAPHSDVVVYPNAIPTVEFPAREERNLIVFSGTMEYEPNRAAVRYFAARIWPVLRREWPDLKWLLVGRNPHAIESYVCDDDRILRTGAVQDAIPHIATAKIAVVPVLSGSGTRLKIIEAWAAGTPVVSTTIGAEGLPARDGEHLLLADDPAGFAAAISRLLNSPADRARISQAARLLYEQEFTWNSAWETLGAELRKVGSVLA